MSYDANKLLGYVWLYRSVSGHYAVDKDNDHFRLWCELLIQSAHQNGRVIMFSGKKITLDKGQLVTGRDVLARKTHIHRSKVERILNFFEIEQQIEQLKTPKGRLITVTKLKVYHSFEQQNEQPASNQRATSEQPVSTNNKGNKEKNEKKRIYPQAKLKILDDLNVRSKLREKFPRAKLDEEIEKMKDWLLSKGVVKKDYVAFARNWLRKVVEEDEEVVRL